MRHKHREITACPCTHFLPSLPPCSQHGSAPTCPWTHHTELPPGPHCPCTAPPGGCLFHLTPVTAGSCACSPWASKSLLPHRFVTHHHVATTRLSLASITTEPQALSPFIADFGPWSNLSLFSSYFLATTFHLLTFSMFLSLPEFHLDH